MTWVFWLLAALMALLALAFVLPPLLRRRAPAAPSPALPATPTGSNLAVLRDQRAQLEAERAAGTVDDDAYALTLAELQRRVIEEEASAVPPPPPATRGIATKSAIALGLCLPLLVGGLYARLGTPLGFDVEAAAAAQQAAAAASAAEIESLVEALAQRMEREPDKVEGWVLLGRSYTAMQRYADASRAYSRALALQPDSAQLLADHADVLAVLQDNSAVGEPTRLIERALALEPDNLKALALAGSAAFERSDFAAAATYWRRALELAPPESPFAASMEASLHEAQSAARTAGNAGNAAAPAAPTAPAPVADAKPAAPHAGLAGRIRLAPELAERVAPTDTVFVFARAAEGPRMPLAIKRYQASALPIEFTLDDSDAMSPEMRLSAFDRVVVGARISKSGDATPRSGDLQTLSDPLSPGRRDLDLVIDRVQP